MYVHGIVCEAKGELICILLSKFTPMISMITAIATALPSIFLSGFNVKIPEMSDLFVPLAKANDFTHAYEAITIATFGFNRCKDYSENLTDIVTPADVSFKNIINNFWQNSNTTQDGSRSFSVLVGQDPDYLEPVVDAFNNFISQITTNETTIETTKPSPSYILDFFEMKEEDFFSHVGVIIGILIAVKVTSYLFLRRKVAAKEE